MKIIISHDVDHLHGTDHLADLYYPKLWVRETLQLLRGRIPAATWARRMAIPLHRDINHLAELMRFDRDNGIPSTFFFGMDKGLGMSYNRQKAQKAIMAVQDAGFATGVHGIAYEDDTAMQAEYQAFTALTGAPPQGIRMHYVRRSANTLQSLSTIGYAFDSTEFDKTKGYCIKAPYPVGAMWEFPLTIMDSYLPYHAQEAKTLTMDILRQTAAKDIGFCTILLHDTNYGSAYPVYRDWYHWLTDYCQQQGHSFISFQDAIEELSHHEPKNGD